MERLIFIEGRPYVAKIRNTKSDIYYCERGVCPLVKVRKFSCTKMLDEIFGANRKMCQEVSYEFEEYDGRSNDVLIIKEEWY